MNCAVKLLDQVLPSFGLTGRMEDQINKYLLEL